VQTTFSALNYCSGILFKPLNNLYEVVRTNFSADFLLFAIFDHNLVKIVAPLSNKYDNSLVHLIGQSLLKKVKTVKIYP